MSFCMYCKTYHDSEDRTKEGNYCHLTHKIKRIKDEACDNFTLNHFFPCTNLRRRQEMVVCLHIQKKLNEDSEKHKKLYQECIKCSQKNEILDLHRAIRDVKPITLVKRPQKDAPDPQIERKKPILLLKKKEEKPVLTLKPKSTLIKRKEK